jgi:1-aminocyclopropane-1-carboxylate deaminase
MDFKTNPIQSELKLVIPASTNKTKVEVWMLREDLIHPEVSGNKWRKLKHNIIQAKESGMRGIVTFGGAYSNHILASAAASAAASLECTVIVRGESIGKTNPTLDRVAELGAELIYVSRQEYRLKNESDFLAKRGLETTKRFVVPEGGSNYLGVKGCMEILRPEHSGFNVITCCQGTGGTAAGLLLSLTENQRLLSFPALKGDFFKNDIEQLLHTVPELDVDQTLSKLSVIDQYHFGGYAKWKPELVAFMTAFHERTGVALDPIYTGKMMFGIQHMIDTEQFENESRVLAIHSGGLQGIAGFNQRFGLNLPS